MSELEAMNVNAGIVSILKRQQHRSTAMFLEGQTPAQAAGVEQDRWTLETVVDVTERFMRAKEDAKFEAALSAQ